MCNGNGKPLKVVLVGCGRVTQNYVQALETSTQALISAVVDVNTEAARELALKFGCPFYCNAEEFLTESMADCAIICTPPLYHADIACQLMQSGLHVLCEKPFALDLVSAARMVRVAEQNKVHLMMASKFRYVSDIAYAKTLIESRILGDILVYENYFCDIVDMRQRWNTNPEISGGGVMIDNGSHSVDIVRYLFGPMTGLRAEEARRIQSPNVEDTVRLTVRSENGVMGTINLSWSFKNVSQDYIRIYGTQGSIAIGWKQSRYQPMGSDRWIDFGRGYNKLDIFRQKVKNFIEVINGTAGPVVGASDGLESVRAIETAYESLRTGQWLKLHPIPDVSTPDSSPSRTPGAVPLRASAFLVSRR